MRKYYALLLAANNPKFLPSGEPAPNPSGVLDFINKLEAELVKRKAAASN